MWAVVAGFLDVYLFLGIIFCVAQFNDGRKARDLPPWYHLLWTIPVVIVGWPYQIWYLYRHSQKGKD